MPRSPHHKPSHKPSHKPKSPGIPYSDRPPPDRNIIATDKRADRNPHTTDQRADRNPHTTDKRADRNPLDRSPHTTNQRAGRWRLYCDLIRLNRPTGTLLLVFPCWWGLALSGGRDEAPYWIFLLGAFAMRSAGCIINDRLDRDFDRRIARTRTRPLATGQIPTGAALIFLAALLVIGAGVLFSLPISAQITGIALFPLIFLYPLAKRFMRWPQIVLALIFNAGVPIGWMVGQSGSVSGSVSAGVLLYAGCFFWTLFYDTTYAIQDRQGDHRLGLGSSALALGRHLGIGLTAFAALAWICWALAASSAGLGIGFWPLSALLACDFAARIAILRPLTARGRNRPGNKSRPSHHHTKGDHPAALAKAHIVFQTSPISGAILTGAWIAGIASQTP